MTITVTPQEAMDELFIHVRTMVDDLDSARITCPTTDHEKGIYLKEEGRELHISVKEPVKGQAYEYTVTIEIGNFESSDFKAVEYRPDICVCNNDYIERGTISGNSLTRTTALGEFTCQADTSVVGEYMWEWNERFTKEVHLRGYAVRSYWDAPTPAAINQAIDDGLAWLRTQQDLVAPSSAGYGSWHGGVPKWPDYPVPDHRNVGMTALAVWSFLHHGAPEIDPDVSKGIEFILSKQLVLDPEHPHYVLNGAIGSCPGYFQPTYETSLSILALIATGNLDYLDETTLAADYLTRSQNEEDVVYPHFPDGITSDNWAYGGWSYHYGGEESIPKEAPVTWDARADLSCTQFAMITLRAAQDAGVVLSHDTWDNVWSKAIKFVSRCQNPDGGFSYQPEGALHHGGSSGRMTAAGVWCLGLSGVLVGDSRVDAGLAWLDYHHFYYYLWTAAKAFTLSDRLPVLVEGNWYYDFAGYLVGYQETNGQWLNPVFPKEEKPT